MYVAAQGVPQDYEAAAKWCAAAASQNEASAQRILGHLYHDGVGVEQNLKLSAKFYKAAAEQGDTSARYFLGVSYRNGEGVQKNYKEAYFWFSLAAFGASPNELELRDKALGAINEIASLVIPAEREEVIEQLKKNGVDIRPFNT